MEKRKNQKGFTTIDVIIAVIVFVIFVPLITTLIYNIGISSKSAERTAKAVNYATQYLEYAKMKTPSSININQLENQISLDSGYDADITLTGDNKITVKITYKVGQEIKSVSLYTNI